MKVWLDKNGERQLVGRADIHDEGQAVHLEHLFGTSSTIVETYTIGVVTRIDEQGRSVVERGIILSPLQRPELLPGWTPLAS